MDSILHPGDATVQTFGPCGVFESDIPDLPEPRREFGACRHNDDIVVCGGYSFLQPLKVSGGILNKSSHFLEEKIMRLQNRMCRLQAI